MIIHNLYIIYIYIHTQIQIHHPWIILCPRRPVSRRSNRSVPRWPSIPRPSSRPPPRPGHRCSNRPKKVENPWEFAISRLFYMIFKWVSHGFWVWTTGLNYESLLCGFSMALKRHLIVPARCPRVLSWLLPQAQKQVTLRYRDLRLVADLRSKGLHHRHNRVACSPHFVTLGVYTLKWHEMAMLGNFHFLDKPGWVKHLEFIWGKRNIRLKQRQESLKRSPHWTGHHPARLKCIATLQTYMHFG